MSFQNVIEFTLNANGLDAFKRGYSTHSIYEPIFCVCCMQVNNIIIVNITIVALVLRNKLGVWLKFGSGVGRLAKKKYSFSFSHITHL